MVFSRLFRRDRPSSEQAGDEAQQAPIQEPGQVAVKERTSGPKKAEVPIPHEKIAQRAFELWCNRGKPHGSEHEDWFLAVAQLRAELRDGSGSSPRKPR